MFDCFVKIDGIEGESTDAEHKGWIETEHYSFATLQNTSTTASSSGGATAERVNFSCFHFSKFLDQTTPKLALACANGTHIDSVVIELCRAGGKKFRFMEYRLSNCMLSKVRTLSMHRLTLPVDVVYINFGKIIWTYTQQNRESGIALGNISAGWNLEKNAKA
jgi:type VI secretion system secreted protein Hcp